jgi:hypothetical protein
MSPFPRYAIVLAMLALLSAAIAWAEPPLYSTPQQGLLLLRNGEVVEGKITPTGDRFHVQLPSGEVWVRAADVEIHCRSLEEGYWLKRSVKPLGTVHGHLDLAQWCIQQGLFGHAADELREALSIEPQHPRIDLLERRLKLAQQRTPKPKAAETSLPPTPSADELDRLVRGMPPGTVETFTSSIQPLLLNSCTSAGCHGPAAEKDPRWVRVSLGRTTSRRLTQRNLHTTLTLINREKPLESPLLTIPVQPHALSKTAVFTDAQASGYRQLVAWVQQVSQGAQIVQPAMVSHPKPLLQNMPPAGVQRASFEAPLPAGAPLPETTPDEIEEPTPSQIRVGPGAIPPRSTPQRGQTPTGFQPKDAFDPAIFNRRFFPGRKEPPATTPQGS